MKELSIYLHVPFCVQKCIYCDFCSFANKNELIDLYFDILKKEIVDSSKKYKNHVIKTIYIGGGTPSYVKQKHIRNVVSVLKKHYNIDKNIEFTIECNPNSVTKSKIESYKKIGINRISIGLQSGDDEQLKILNRPHTTRDFEKAMKIIQSCGIENYNIDILIGIPNQTKEIVQKTLDFVLSFHPTSISAYDLIVEDGTLLEKKLSLGELKLPTESKTCQFGTYITNRLRKTGYNRYEVSNYAQKGKQSKHNMVYWFGADYVGFGASAHSKIGNNRFCNTSSLEEYIKGNILKESVSLTMYDQCFEYIMLRLRTNKGIDINEFNSLFDCDILKDKYKELNYLKQNKLITIRNGCIVATQKGFNFLNLVTLKLIYDQ